VLQNVTIGPIKVLGKSPKKQKPSHGNFKSVGLAEKAKALPSSCRVAKNKELLLPEHLPWSRM